MTTDPDELNYLRVMLLKKRNQNSYWKWPDQPVEECGIASDILGEAGVNVAGMRSLERGQDPPDCEATLEGRFSGVEVTELIDQRALEQRLHHPGSPVFDWDKPTFLAALQKLIEAKDRAWKGGPYECRVLVIHADEYVLDCDTVSRFLKEALFRATFITVAFLGLSYHSSVESEGGCCPVFRLEHEVLLSVPQCEILPPVAAAEKVLRDDNPGLVAVRQDFAGPFSGRALLIFPEVGSLELMRVVLGRHVPRADILDLEDEALAEVGNIILNSWVATIAKMLKQSFKMSLPAVIRRDRHYIFESGSQQEALILFLHIKFDITKQEVQGYLALIMDLASIEQLRSLIGELLKSLNPETG